MSRAGQGGVIANVEGLILSIRNVLKKALGLLYSFSPHVRRAVDSGLTVFTFHDVSDEPSEFARRYGLCVSNATFERQVRWIQENFEIVHPAAILAHEPLPKRAAIISFDDGYLGTFENGLRILERLEAPSIVFLNMQPIIHGTALMSAAACYLDDSSLDFSDFCLRAGLRRPFHLSLTPDVFEAYQRKYGAVDQKAVTQFQGKFADLALVKKWDGKPLVCYGNHLYEHWNATALTADQFQKEYQDNDQALSELISKVNLFAFTNGQPNSCFTARELTLLKEMGAGKAFSTAGGVNNSKDSFLQGRVALCEGDNDATRLWFRIGRAVSVDGARESLL